MTQEEQVKKKFRRKWINYIIYPRFQLSLLLLNLFTFLSGIGLIVYQVMTSWKILGDAAEQRGAIDAKAFRELMVSIEADFIMTVWLLCIFGSLLIAVFIVVFSHKVLGAIYRLRLYFKGIKERGHKSELSFRENDFYEDLPELVNDAIERIKADKEVD